MVLTKTRLLKHDFPVHGFRFGFLFRIGLGSFFVPDYWKRPLNWIRSVFPLLTRGGQQLLNATGHIACEGQKGTAKIPASQHNWTHFGEGQKGTPKRGRPKFCSRILCRKNVAKMSEIVVTFYDAFMTFFYDEFCHVSKETEFVIKIVGNCRDVSNKMSEIVVKMS